MSCDLLEIILFLNVKGQMLSEEKIQWRSIKCKRRSSGVAEKIKWRSIKCKRRSSGEARDRCSIIPTPPHPTPPPLRKSKMKSAHVYEVCFGKIDTPRVEISSKTQITFSFFGYRNEENPNSVHVHGQNRQPFTGRRIRRLPKQQ